MSTFAWFLAALPLALDVFAVGLVFGLAGLERVRWLSVSFLFAAIGGLMIAAGILAGEALTGAFGTAALFVAAIVLLAIGLRAIVHGLEGNDSPKVPSLDSRRIASTAIAVAVDKLAIGLTFATLGAPLGPMVVIVGGQALVATFLGLLLGKRFGTRAGDAAELIAGFVFTVLGLIVLYKAFSSRG